MARSLRYKHSFPRSAPNSLRAKSSVSSRRSILFARPNTTPEHVPRCVVLQGLGDARRARSGTFPAAPSFRARWIQNVIDRPLRAIESYSTISQVPDTFSFGARAVYLKLRWNAISGDARLGWNYGLGAEPWRVKGSAIDRRMSQYCTTLSKLMRV